ncbi:MAG: alpha/beta hydrolase [Chloroflexi bacterium]|nr:alpha/beta hydrolase [Chloroflexota bacterium]
MPKATINGIELYYEVHGSGPTVVFCHGASGSHLSWWQQVPDFSKYYRCITYDQRGFGQSLDARNGSGAKALVDDLDGLLLHLNIREIHLVCQDLGGYTGMGFALKYPSRVKSLTLSGSHGWIIDQDTIAKALRARNNHKNREGDLMSLSVSSRLQRERPAVAFLFKQIAGLNPTLSRDYFQRIPASPPPRVLLSKLIFPTLFVVGEEDEMTPPEIVEAAHRQLLNSMVYRVPGSGHSSYFERPELFNPRVLSFVDQPVRI